MNVNTENYKELLTYYIQMKARSFDDLSFKAKKEIVLSYLKTLCPSDQEEIMEEAYAKISHEMPKMVVSILTNSDDRFDPMSELVDEFIKSIVEYTGDFIDEDINDLIYGYDAGFATLETFQEMREQDHFERARGLNKDQATAYTNVINFMFGER